MQKGAERKSSFAFLNSALRAPASAMRACPYSWDDDTVMLKNPDFNEQAYKAAKLEALFQKESVLSIQERMNVLANVFYQHEDLILQISYATNCQWQELNRQLDLIIESVYEEKEHEMQLRISRDKIQKAQMLDNGWMSSQDVNQLLSLGAKRNGQAASPNPLKFVNTRRY